MSKKHPTKQEYQDYLEREKVCKTCGTKFYKPWSKGSMTEFCCKRCSKRYSSLKNRDNKKVSEGLRKFYASIVEKNIEKYLETSKICPICGKVVPYNKRRSKTCSYECGLKLITKTRRERGTYKKTGGYREGSGRSKSGYYKGFYCGSTYELVYYIYCLDNNIKIERNTKTFLYEWGGVIKTYLPDFRTDEGLIEIKGYYTKQVDAKLKSVDEPIKILYLEDLEPMMTYVDNNYMITSHKGKSNNYHVLYDGYKPKYTYKCDYCGKDFSTDKKKITKEKFCSKQCSGKFGRSKEINLYTKDFIENNTLPFEDFTFIRIDKDKNLYSNKRKFKDGKYEKLVFKLKNDKRRYKLYTDEGKVAYRYL